MPNASWSDALAEAYAAAPVDVVILHTLELRHPAFVDLDTGQATAIRVVRDQPDLVATLEADAPQDPGATVTFVRFAFDFKLPDGDDSGVADLVITLDGISGEIVEHLDQAAASPDPIEVTYRPYLSDDLTGPQMDPPLHLTIVEVSADVFRVTARARMHALTNARFPGIDYTPDRFPTL